MNSFQTAIIDADGIPFIGGCKAYALGKDEDYAMNLCKSLLNTIFGKTGCENYIMFFGTPQNFRNNVSSDYKSNRQKAKQTLPPYLFSLKQRLIKDYKAYSVYGAEADDACATIATRLKDNSVLVSNDKDLLQVNCIHYNYRTTEFVDATSNKIIQKSNKKYLYTGIYMYYYQMLTGDRADNIKGVVGIGPVKAHNVLLSTDDSDLEEAIMEEYRKVYADDWEKEYEMNSKLLKMRTDLNIPTPNKIMLEA